MNKYRLPKSIEINEKECPIDSDYRNILYIFEIFNDPDLLEREKISIALKYFYTTDDYLSDVDTAVKEMVSFMAAGTEDDSTPQKEPEKPLYDWERDFDIIIAPVNRVIGHDIRGDEYLHWWTFLSAFMEIGECTFNTFVGIRRKLNKNIKLDQVEEKIYRDNKSRILLPEKHDKTTQAILDEIMGKEV